MKNLKYALALAVLLASPQSFASTQVAGWAVLADKSHLEFSGKESGKEFKGQFKTFDCTISFDKANLSASSIAVSVDTSSALTGDKTYDDPLPGSDWFNVKDFPTAKFTSTTIKAIPAPNGRETYEAQGTLTILGISKPITVPFSLTNLTPDGKTLLAEGELTLKRLDFGLGKSVDSKGDTVSDDIRVKFDITAQRK